MRIRDWSSDVCSSALASWETCTIAESGQQTATIKGFFLRLSKPFAHIAGQQVDVRLTAPDGYLARCRYLIASSARASNVIEIAVECLPDGEAPTFLHNLVAVGDEIDLSGPIGRQFLCPSLRHRPVVLKRVV